MPLKYRISIILALVVLSIWALVPRDVTVRQRDENGILKDVKQRRIPLKYGLDLSGGMYIALEVDDSKQKIPASDKAEAIDRALKTVRSRIEGIGVSESVVQKQGNDRIVVQVPGIQDEERARKLVQEQAVLEFKITDKTQALERALPRIDQVIKQRGITAKLGGDTAGKAPTTVAKGLQGLLKSADTSKADSAKKVASATGAKDSAAKADSLKIEPGGAFSSLLQQGSMQGEFYVAMDQIPTLQTYLADSVVEAAFPPGKDFVAGTDSISLQGKWYRAYYSVDSKPIITGDYIKTATPNTNTMDGTVVEFTLSNEGGRRFRSETGKHVGDFMAIILDKRVMGRPPVIQSAIGTRGQITMAGRS
ncbi:MAG TPA: hypothetical protein VGP95_13350, partial [Gemmatimonadaceae bacterium]|nr:hypothetical protein [Gemmatimonadaceae bacterium]